MKKFLIFILLLFLIPLALAAAPITQVSLTAETPSVTIVYPKNIILNQSSTVTFPFDILNANYSRLTNTTTSCSFFMIDDSGSGITSGNLTYSDTLNYWHYDLNQTHTSIIGHYSYYVHCNESSKYFGFISEEMEITSDGHVEENVFAITLTLSLFSLIFIILGACLFMRGKFNG